MAAILYDLLCFEVSSFLQCSWLYLFSEITQWPSAVKCRSVALAYHAFQMHLHALVLKKMYDPVNVVILSFLTFVFSCETDFGRSL